MYYNSGMGEYTNDYMEPILGTCYLTDVPYKIDKEKYNKIVSNLGKEKKYTISGCRFNDADVVSFMLGAYYDEEDDKPILKSKALTIFPKNSPKDSKDLYDCFQVWYDRCDNVEEEYKSVVNAILGTIIGPDEVCVGKLIDDLTSKKTDLDDNINTLKQIMSNNKKDKINELNSIVEVFESKAWKDTKDIHFEIRENYLNLESDFRTLPKELNEPIIETIKQYKQRLECNFYSEDINESHFETKKNVPISETGKESLTESYVSFDTAVLLKEKGFDVPTREHYYSNGIMSSVITEYNQWNDNSDMFSAPTQQLTMRWLRETTNYELNVFCTEVDENFKRGYSYDIYNVIDVEEKSYQEHGFNTYEEAVEAALKCCLEHCI